MGIFAITPGSREEFNLIIYSLGVFGSGALAIELRKKNPADKKWKLFAVCALLNAVLLVMELL